jgi:hypothetical protein
VETQMETNRGFEGGLKPTDGGVGERTFQLVEQRVGGHEHEHAAGRGDARGEEHLAELVLERRRVCCFVRRVQRHARRAGVHHPGPHLPEGADVSVLRA